MPGLYTPSIEGLSYRNYLGEQDLPAMLDVFLSLHLQDHENILESLDDIFNKYRHLANCDPHTDVLIAEINHCIAAYGRVRWYQPAASHDTIFPMEWWIRPEYQGLGLEKAFLERSKERVRQIIRLRSNTPADGTPTPEGRRLFDIDVLNLQPAIAKLLEEDGFQAVRWFAMMTCSNLQNTPNYPLPFGLEVRPAKPEEYCQVWGALLDGFRDDPGYSEPDEDDYTGWLHSSQFQPDLWQIAWDGSQIAGMVLNYITSEQPGEGMAKIAWTEDICVGGPWRRRGIARALLARSMRMFSNMGFAQTSLGVDLNNPQSANKLYESMGYEVVRRGARYQKPVDL